jgi:hypothetical protein
LAVGETIVQTGAGFGGDTVQDFLVIMSVNETVEFVVS